MHRLIRHADRDQNPGQRIRGTAARACGVAHAVDRALGDPRATTVRPVLLVGPLLRLDHRSALPDGIAFRVDPHASWSAVEVVDDPVLAVVHDPPELRRLPAAAITFEFIQRL
jgi:hypothetical protein